MLLENFSKELESLDKESNAPSLNAMTINDHQQERNNFKAELEKIEKTAIEINNQIKKLNNDLIKLREEHAPVQEVMVVNNNPHNNKSIKIVEIKPNPIISSGIQQFEYLLGVKGRSSEITIVPINSFPNCEVTTIKLQSENFTDSYGFSSFPLDHSRYVNLHYSILVTGGMEKGKSFENCYLITITKENSPNKYTATVTNYAPMRQTRERHNIIYLDYLGAVLVCSGFYTKTCEINYLSSNDIGWRLLPSMHEYRANATIFCVNKRYVYCVGGFQVLDKERPQGGVYLNSAEYIDTANFNIGWKKVELNSFCCDIKLCAMGAINLSPNKILVVGGYDGQRYLTEANEFVFDQDGCLIKIIHKGAKKELGKGVIFTSNQNFISTPSRKMINNDSNCRVISFDLDSEDFAIRV